MRVAIYARVSTDDRGQDPANQLRELRDWVTNSGHVISREYVDYESGRKGAEKRKQFAALFDDAAKRKFDCVLFWALDRFSREGMAQTVTVIGTTESFVRSLRRKNTSAAARRSGRLNTCLERMRLGGIVRRRDGKAKRFLVCAWRYPCNLAKYARK